MASRLPAQRSIVDARMALRPCTQTGTFFPGNWRFPSATGLIFHACPCISETFSDLPSKIAPPAPSMSCLPYLASVFT